MFHYHSFPPHLALAAFQRGHEPSGFPIGFIDSQSLKKVTEKLRRFDPEIGWRR
jgi:hypothetical protein